jgi:hypothetical protein
MMGKERDGRWRRVENKVQSEFYFENPKSAIRNPKFYC